MSLGLCILMILFVALLCINVPIAFILGIVTVAAAFSLGYEQVLVTIASCRFGHQSMGEHLSKYRQYQMAPNYQYSQIYLHFLVAPRQEKMLSLYRLS